MKKRSPHQAAFAVSLALAAWFAVPPATPAATLAEDFSADPSQNGWTVFGETNLYHWDSTNHQLIVTWDSTKPNSYFYHSLGGYLTRYDDFTFEFDLRLADIASDVEPGKTGPLQIGIGFQNYSVATNSNYSRGYGMVSDIAECDYYPHGFYDFGGGVTYDSPPSFVPSFVSDESAFSPTTLKPYYVLELPTNVVVHITMVYAASNQTATVTAATNGLPVGTVPSLVLDSPTNSNFTLAADYRVDIFSITSYSSAGDDYDSVLAHGVIANLRVDLPPPVQNLAGCFSNGVWQVQFSDRTNWVYSLQRTTDLVSWSEASSPAGGNGTSLVLQDTNAPPENGFYRVRARRP